MVGRVFNTRIRSVNAPAGGSALARLLLATIVVVVFAALAAPAGADTGTPPLLTAHGTVLRWTSAGTRHLYKLMAIAEGKRTVSTTARRWATPPEVPGQTVIYRVKAAYAESTWSNAVWITYPMPEEEGLPKPEPPPTPEPPPAPEPPKPPEIEPPFPPPPAPEPGAGAAMAVGLDAGGWGPGAFADIAGAVGSVRLQSRFATDSEVGGAAAAGVTVGSWLVGTGGTIGAIDPATYAAQVVALFKRYGKGGTFWAGRPDLGGQAVEVLNEPGNPYFWSDPSNFAGYVQLVRTVKQALKAAGLGNVKVLVSWDGGFSGDTYGEALLKAGLTAADYDGVTVHPYGGHGSISALGNHERVERAWADSGKPVYVTEIGWPTAVGKEATGDSLQWTEAQQAENITHFIAWARETGYVDEVVVFNYVDYGTNNWYGIERTDRTHKLSYAALAAASH